MHVKRKCASGPFWEKMNSEIFSYLEFHTQDEKARAEVRSFRQKHVFFSVWTYSWWPWWSHFFIQMFKLIRRRKKRMKERRKKWLKRSRPRSEHQKHKKLNEYISTWQPNYNWKAFWGKKLMFFFSWNVHLFPSYYWYCPFLHFVWLRTSINQGMETWNAFDQINSFRYSFSSVQDQTQIHVMDWILGWPFVKVVPAILVSPKYLLTPFPLPPLQYGHFGALFPPETNLASAFTFWK